MDHSPPSHQPLAPPPTPGAGLTLADVIVRLDADPGLAPRRRAELLSAVQTLCRLLNAAPDAIPAQPKILRQRLATVSPAAGGIGRGRWNNVRSLTLAALKLAGVRTMRGRTRALLTLEWESLRARLRDTEARYGLSRFMSRCSEQQIAPTAVDAAVFERFRQALDTDSLVKKPHAVHRTTCVLWNHAARTIDGWPPLTVPVPSASRRYALQWQDFPVCFRVDAEAFLERSANQDPFADDYAPSVKPSTTQLRRGQILRIATALTASGVAVDTITGLAVLTELAHAKLALRFFLDRAGGKPQRNLHQQALLLKTIARHWVKAPAAQVEALGGICRKLVAQAHRHDQQEPCPPAPVRQSGECRCPAHPAVPGGARGAAK
jgi:hypothetical protein